eukprot:5520104-Prymnesium_polylepis.1
MIFVIPRRQKWTVPMLGRRLRLNGRQACSRGQPRSDRHPVAATAARPTYPDMRGVVTAAIDLGV